MTKKEVLAKMQKMVDSFDDETEDDAKIECCSLIFLTDEGGRIRANMENSGMSKVDAVAYVIEEIALDVGEKFARISKTSQLFLFVSCVMEKLARLTK
jgi:hypothetical protein